MEDRNEPQSEPHRTGGAAVFSPRLVVGVIVLALGLLFTLANLGVIDAEEWLPYWPVLLIVLGVARILQGVTGAGRGGGVILAAVGVLLLLQNLEVTHLRFHQVAPIFLILLGGWIVWGAAASRSGRRIGVDSSSTVWNLAVMAGIERKYNTKDLRRGDVVAIMGGCEIDLSDASISAGEAVIDVFAMWGGIDIIVPPDWTVVSRVIPLMGGYEDSRRSQGADPTKTLVVKGMAIMGGVEVKN